MKYAIISDIHANLQAWKAVLIDIRSIGVDKIICLGDVIGYGPNPAEVLEETHAAVDYFVMGNHEAVVCGKMNVSLFNENAGKSITWTQNQLSKEAVNFLASFPLTLRGTSFRCSHGDFANPSAFDYVITPENALSSWEAVEENLLFVGHTHEPGIFVIGASHTPHLIKPQDFVVEEEKRYLVNVGSVGQPRDRQARAVYCIYDTAEQSVVWRYIPFDLDAYREALKKKNLTDETSFFLYYDPRKDIKPLRETLNFSPPQDRKQNAKDTVEVQELDILQKKVRKWKSAAIAVLLVFLFAGFTTGFLTWRNRTRERIITGSLFHTVLAEAFSSQEITSRQRTPIPAAQNILFANPDGSTPYPDLSTWRIIFGNKYKQDLRIDKNKPAQYIISSADPDAVVQMESRPIKVKPDARFRTYAAFKKSPDFKGSAHIYIDVRTGGKPLEFEWQRIAADSEGKDGTMLARKVFPETDNPLPPETTIQFLIKGCFEGKLTISDLGLARIE